MAVKLTMSIKLTIAAVLVAVCTIFAFAMFTPAYALTGNIAERESYAVNVIQSDGGTIETDASVGEVVRYAGDTRYDTATAVNEAVANTNIYNGVIVASGENSKFADALCAAGLSGMLDYPVVLVDGSATSLDTQARNTIDSLLGGKQGEIIVLGGASTVSGSVLRALREYDSDAYVQRYAGDDRYETACEAYNSAIKNGLWDKSQIVIAKGNDFPDALGVAAYCSTYGIPVLLTDSNEDDAEGYILSAARNAKSALIVGGESSITTDKESTLSRYTSVERVAGADRYETSLALTRWECAHGMDISTIGVATGMTFPDALGSSGLLSIYNAPLLLVSNDTVSTLCDYVSDELTTCAIIFGGMASVSDTVEAAITECVVAAGAGFTYAGNTVTVTTTPDWDRTLNTITVATATDAVTTVQTKDSHMFVMPNADVNITATWSQRDLTNDAAMTAYANVLDQYRRFVTFVNNGGDVNSLEIDSVTHTPVDYPYVNYVYTWHSFVTVECTKYAYVDLDNNGIPELVVGDGSDQPIEVYTYRKGEVVFLFGITGARDFWHLESNGYIFRSGSGGADVKVAEFYVVDSTEESGLKLVESITYDWVNGNNRMNDNSPYLVTHITSEGTEEFTTTYKEAQKIVSEMVEKYLSIDSKIVLDWQDL